MLDYNTSNLVAWKASGQTLTDPLNCQRGNVTTNQKVNYIYDRRDRLEQTQFGDGSPAITTTFTLDGLPWTVQSDNSTWTTLYNKRRLMTSETLVLGGASYPLAHTHSANGHIKSLTYPDGVLVDYAPNALGEATKVGGYATDITRHPNGSLATLTYGNGIAHVTQQNVRGLPSRITDTGTLDDGYSYDENGNVSVITDHFAGAFTRTMTYDDRDRLKTATNTPLWGGLQSFEYDPLDNLREMATPKNGAWVYRYNALTRRLDQIDRPSDGLVILSYGYDTRGRATNRASTGAAQTFTVDLADRVNSVGPSVATYRYDGHGRRTSVTKASVTTVQVYSQAGQLMYQSSPASDGIFRSGFQSGDAPYPPATGGNKRYVYLGRTLIAEDGTTGRQYIHTDGLGSPARKTSVTGVPSGREDYKPYGYVFSPAQSTPGFAGHVTDAETGLSYMQARYYDPYAGRFLAVDPVDASAASFNRYWYANNNPYKHVDPDGQQSRDFNSISKEAGVTPPPRAKGDWLGPAIGVALTGILAAPVVAEAYMVAAANPGAVIAASNFVGEAAGVGGAGIGANRLAGKAAERLAAKELVAEGNNLLGSQVGAQTSAGLRFIDHLIETPAGKLVAVEVKSGNATRSTAQLAKDGKMATEGAVIVGKNAPVALDGRRAIMETVERNYPRK